MAKIHLVCKFSMVLHGSIWVDVRTLSDSRERTWARTQTRNIWPNWPICHVLRLIGCTNLTEYHTQQLSQETGAVPWCTCPQTDMLCYSFDSTLDLVWGYWPVLLLSKCRIKTIVFHVSWNACKCNIQFWTRIRVRHEHRHAHTGPLKTGKGPGVACPL